MARFEIRYIQVLSDNFVYFLREPDSGAVAVVDPSVDEQVLAAAKEWGWQITHILNTHHHPDHTGGNEAIKAATGATIVGPRPDRERIPGIDVEVDEGDTYAIGDQVAKVFFVPGHTRGHIAYWFEDSKALFSGDTLFLMGCGRLFEGTAEQMWTSLKKLRGLPDDTRVYCGHEYTLANAKFAVTVDPDNAALRDRLAEVEAKREANEYTVPGSLAVERATNPFLRADDTGVARSVGLEGADPVAVFAEVRSRKDSF